MPIPVSTSPLTLFAPLQAQPTLGFGGMGFITWSGRKSAGAPYVPGVDADSYDTYHTSTGDICIPDNAGTISIPLGAIYPRFPAVLGGYSTFPLHPMLGKGIPPHAAVYNYEVSCRYDILAYADPDLNNVSATAVTDFDVVTSGLLTFTNPKCGYQDGYTNDTFETTAKPFEAGTRVANLEINVHGIGKFPPTHPITLITGVILPANKNRFKVRFHTPIGMNLPGFTNDAIATEYFLYFRILGTTPAPVYWQDYGTIDCGHVRGHVGLNDVSPPGSLASAGFASGYNPKVAELTLPFTSAYKRIHPNGTDVMNYRDWMSYPDLADPTDNGKRYLGMEVDVTRWVGWHTTFQDYNTTLPSLPSGVPIAVTGKIIAEPTTDVFVTHPGEFSGIPTLSFSALNGPPFTIETNAAYLPGWIPNPLPSTLYLGPGSGAPPSGTGLAGTVDSMLIVYQQSVTFVASGGTGYTKGDVLTLDDGTAVEDCEITVTSVDGSGVILTALITNPGEYTTLPSGSVTGGSGTGASFAIHYGVKSVSISSVGSGYTYGARVVADGAIQFENIQFNNPGKTTTAGVITTSVNRYSSLLLEQYTSDNYDGIYSLYDGGFNGFFGFGTSYGVTVVDKLFNQLSREVNQAAYGSARYPNPQSSEFLIEATPSGLVLSLPQVTSSYLVRVGESGPRSEEYTDVIHFRKTNEYTVSDFEDDFDILDGVATPVFGAHKAVMFEADATEFVRHDEGVGWFESTGVYSYQDVDGRTQTENLIGVTMTAAGTGYTSAPAVTPSVGSAAFLAVLETTSVDSLTLDDAGDLFTVEPTIRIEGGGGTGATAHVDLVATEVDHITVTHPGTGFTSIPGVTVSGSATAVAVLKATAVDDVTITDPGRGYTTIPTVAFTPIGGIVVQVTLKLVPQASPSPEVIVAAPGTGYTVGDLLYFGLGSDLVTAAVLQVDSVNGSGGVLTASIATAGSWTIDPPANPMGGGQGGTGTGATFNVKWGVNTVSGPLHGDYLDVVGEFSGSYQDIPTIAFVGTCDVAASATAVLKCTSVESVTLTGAGSGYTARPTVSFSGGGGVQAQASAFLVGTPIASITLDSGGSGYKSAPTVYFDIYGIAGGASVTAVLAGRGVDHIEILSPVGAINPMTLVISGGGGSGATADAVFETARIDETNTTPMTSGVATWQWVNPPSGVPVVFGIVNDSSPSGPIHGRSYYSVPAGHLNFPAIANPPDYSEGGWLSPFANPAEGNADPSNLNQTVLGQAWGDSGWSSGADIIIAGNFFGIVGWYSGIPQAVIDEKLVYRWQRRGIIGSGNTYIEQEYPVRVNAIIKTYSWGRGSVFTPGTYPYFRPSVLINTRRVDITEMASYIVEPPAPQVGYEDGGYCTCTFEYVCDQGMAVAPGLASYP